LEKQCSDGKTLVLVCDECDAVWTHPGAITAETVLFPSSPDFRIEGLGCSIAAGYGSRWATLEEIRAAQMETLIAGEGQALETGEGGAPNAHRLPPS
jgi:hypothetical protein